MVDITSKKKSKRKSSAQGFIVVSKEVLRSIETDNLEKGDLFNTARIAGIIAAKKTSELIPLCHPLSISKIDINFNINDNGIEVITNVSIEGKTGVEMEALTATSIACLTIYDMNKSIDKESEITSIRLISKSGGKSGNWKRK